MARSGDAKNVYGFREFTRDLKEGRLYPCYLMTGTEEYVKEQCFRDLRARVLSGPVPDMNETRLNDPDADTLIAANETLPFMADRRLVAVRESGLLSGKPGDYDEETSAEALKEYLTHLPATSVLVFLVRGEADKRKKLYKAAEASEHCRIVTFSALDENDQRKWLITRCKKEQVEMSPGMADRMIFRTGGGIDVLQTEADKLCAYLGPGGTVDEAALDAVVTRNTEYKAFDLSQLVLSGDGSRAFRTLEGLLLDGEERLRLLPLLGYQCRQLLKTAVLAAQGESDVSICRLLGIPSFVVQQTRRLARRFTPAQLRRLPGLCEETEFAVKSGKIPDEGSLEKVMLEILLMGDQNGKPETTPLS